MFNSETVYSCQDGQKKNKLDFDILRAEIKVTKMVAGLPHRHSVLNDIKWITDAGKITVWLLKSEWHQKSLSEGESSSKASPMVQDPDSSLCPHYGGHRERDTQ